MKCVLNNNKYNKIKIIEKLSCLDWFIQKHAEKDAHESGNAQIASLLHELRADLQKHICAFEKLLEKQ